METSSPSNPICSCLPFLGHCGIKRQGSTSIRVPSLHREPQSKVTQPLNQSSTYRRACWPTQHVHTAAQRSLEVVSFPNNTVLLCFVGYVLSSDFPIQDEQILTGPALGDLMQTCNDYHFLPVINTNCGFFV